jgi:hypothetical protein
VNDFTHEHGPAKHRTLCGAYWIFAHVLFEFRRIAVTRNEGIGVAFRPVNGCTVGIAQLSSRSDQRVEHCLKVEGRAADNLQDIGGSGLLLKGFAQLIEQPGVLDGDDSLGGEVCDQRNLLFSKREYFLLIDANGTDQFAFLEHWHHDKRSNPGHIDARDNHRVAFRVARLIF